ncbi:hypothetical protein LINGRAHAP2_LOCUS23502 [Linum grandiflorum]
MKMTASQLFQEPLPILSLPQQILLIFHLMEPLLPQRMIQFQNLLNTLANGILLHCTNDHMRSAAHRLVFHHGFRNRHQLDTIQVSPIEFSKLGNLSAASFIANLGWSSLCSPRDPICFPEAVAQFYCNLQVEGNLMNGVFTTFVDGYFLHITPLLLSQILAPEMIMLSCGMLVKMPCLPRLLTKGCLFGVLARMN